MQHLVWRNIQFYTSKHSALLAICSSIGEVPLGKTTEYDDVPAFVPYRADGGYLRKRNSRISFESFSVFDADTVLYDDVKM